MDDRKIFLNEERKRYYGVRVGDIVKNTYAPHEGKEGTVVKLDPLDNNLVYVDYGSKYVKYIPQVAEDLIIIKAID